MTSNIIVDNDISASQLLNGTKLNFVLVGVTESGPKTDSGQTLLFEIVLKNVTEVQPLNSKDENSTLLLQKSHIIKESQILTA